MSKIEERVKGSVELLESIEVFPRIDRMILNLKYVDPKEVLNFLKANELQCIGDHRVNETNFQRQAKFEFDGSELRVLYGKVKNIAYLPNVQIQIHDVSLKGLQLLKKLEGLISGKVTISHIELALDFFPKSESLREFFQKYLFVKYQQQPDQKFIRSDNGMTSYIGNKKKHSKSLIIYDKTIDNENDSKEDKDILRLELRLNRRAIKNLKLKLLPASFKNFDMTKFVQLRKWDLVKFMEWRYRNFKELTFRQKLLLMFDPSTLYFHSYSVRTQITGIKNGHPNEKNILRFFPVMKRETELLSEHISAVEFV